MPPQPCKAFLGSHVEVVRSVLRDAAVFGANVWSRCERQFVGIGSGGPSTHGRHQPTRLRFVHPRFGGGFDARQPVDQYTTDDPPAVGRGHPRPWGPHAPATREFPQGPVSDPESAGGVFDRPGFVDGLSQFGLGTSRQGRGPGRAFA